MTARKNIFDIIKSQRNIAEEIQRIDTLFTTQSNVYNDEHARISFGFYNNRLIEQLIDETLFYQWKAREGCTSCLDMRTRLGIAPGRVYSDNIDEIIIALEYFYNMKALVFEYEKLPGVNNTSFFRYSKEVSMAFGNMDLLLESLNLQEVISKEEERVYLVPKSAAAIAAAEIAPKTVAFAILKYNHASIKGDIEEKRKLLLSIAQQYESLFKKPIEGYARLFDAITNGLNNLNIRHNNIDEKSKKNYRPKVKEMTPEELERWYDELYQMMLLAVLAADNKKRLPEVEAMLKKISDSDKMKSSDKKEG